MEESSIYYESVFCIMENKIVLFLLLTGSNRKAQLTPPKL